MSDQSFGGQRASIGRSVLVYASHYLRAGVINTIEYGADTPNIVDSGDGHEHPVGALSFFDAKSAADSWAWPPRV